MEFHARERLVRTTSSSTVTSSTRHLAPSTMTVEPGTTSSLADGKLSVLYVENGPDGVRIRRLRVDERGEFKDRWPKGFFAERMEELL